MAKFPMQDPLSAQGNVPPPDMAAGAPASPYPPAPFKKVRKRRYSKTGVTNPGTTKGARLAKPIDLLKPKKKKKPSKKLTATEQGVANMSAPPMM